MFSHALSNLKLTGFLQVEEKSLHRNRHYVDELIKIQRSSLESDTKLVPAELRRTQII